MSISVATIRKDGMCGKMGTKVNYDHRLVVAHGSETATVYLLNEAPGPREARSGIPAVAQQGGNIYRALIDANITWATNFNHGRRFSWPRYDSPRDYAKPHRHVTQFALRDAFLAVRGRYVKCSNAYPYWPKRDGVADGWEDPEPSDILCQRNLQRISCEITRDMTVLLVCGEYAWLARTGETLDHPEQMEGQALSANHLARINKRFKASFSHAW